MATISQIKLPSGTTYDLKDAQARQDIESIEQKIVNGTHWVGPTTTPLADKATTAVIVINGENHTVENGDIAQYGNSEFIATVKETGGTKTVLWDLYGEAGSFGALAFKNSATGTAELTGTATGMSFTGTESTISSTGTTSGVAVDDISYTPAGSVTESGSVDVSVVTDVDVTAGVAPTFSQGEDSLNMTVTNEVLEISFVQGQDTFGAGTPTAVTPTSSTIKNMNNATYAFTGTAATLQHSVTQGTVAASATYTPAGSVGDGTVSASGDIEVS